MKYRIAGQVAAMVLLALAGIAGFKGAAMGQTQKPETAQAPNQNSGRSSPPDTTPYVRPVIPEDRASTPVPPQRPTGTPPPASRVPDGDPGNRQ